MKKEIIAYIITLLLLPDIGYYAWNLGGRDENLADCITAGIVLSLFVWGIWLSYRGTEN